MKLKRPCASICFLLITLLTVVAFGLSVYLRRNFHNRSEGSAQTIYKNVNKLMSESISTMKEESIVDHSHTLKEIKHLSDTIKNDVQESKTLARSAIDSLVHKFKNLDTVANVHAAWNKFSHKAHDIVETIDDSILNERDKVIEVWDKEMYKRHHKELESIKQPVSEDTASVSVGGRKLQHGKVSAEDTLGVAVDDVPNIVSEGIDKVKQGSDTNIQRGAAVHMYDMNELPVKENVIQIQEHVKQCKDTSIDCIKQAQQTAREVVEDLPQYKPQQTLEQEY